MEEWRPIVGYEELYEVSDMGRVRSKRKNTRIIDREKLIMKQKIDDHGYLRVNLTNGKKQKTHLVSRLVATAFVFNPDPNRYTVVGHDDDIKTHNMACNLYWTDQKENNNHNGKMERFQQLHRDKMPQIIKRLSIPVIGTKLSDGTEIRFESMQAARKNGFDGAKISKCCSGERKSHKGYKWRKDL